MINQTTRDEIEFEWTAKHSDGTVVQQYDDEKSEEHHFGHVNLDTVSTFTLRSKRLSPVFSYRLDLKTGTFFLNNMIIPTENKVRYGETAKLIYFRNYRRMFTPGDKEIVRINYRLGWECDGRKCIIDISDKGEYLVME